MFHQKQYSLLRFRPVVLNGGATAPQGAFGEPKRALGEYLHHNY